MKKLLLTVGMFLCIGHTYAQNYCVVINTTSGEEVCYRFEDFPKLFHQNEIVIVKTKKVEVEYMTREIKQVRIAEEQVTNVEPVLLKKGFANFVEDGIILDGFEPNELVRIYSMGGFLIDSYIIPSDGSLYIKFSSLPKGGYIIKTNNQTFKILVK